jgi:anti-sigma regulatory factor (Ser/Thr protein kinase)
MFETLTAEPTMIRLLPASTEMAAARELCDQIAESFGLDNMRRYQFKLAVSEALANAIEHGAPLSDGSIHLEFREDGDDLTCIITDGGSFMPIPDEPEVLPERGRGLAFMSALADHIDISHFEDGTSVALSFSR